MIYLRNVLIVLLYVYTRELKHYENSHSGFSRPRSKFKSFQFISI